MLRRMTHALREQNWTTIVIEFALLYWCSVWTAMRTDRRFKGIQQRAGWPTSVEKEYPR